MKSLNSFVQLRAWCDAYRPRIHSVDKLWTISNETFCSSKKWKGGEFFDMKKLKVNFRLIYIYFFLQRSEVH